MTKFEYIVTVECETKEQAEEVLVERLGYDEWYGFDYWILPDWKLVNERRP